MPKIGRRLVSNKDQWQKILAKISPLTESTIDECLKNIDSFFSGVDQLYSYSDKLTVLLEKHPCPDWSAVYNDDVSKAMLEITAPLFADPSFLQRIANDPSQLSQLFSNPPIESKTANKHYSDEKNILAFIITFRAQIIDGAAFLIYRKKMHVLIQEAKAGDNDVLFQVITLDKALITSDWIAERIRKETLRGNAEFLKQIGLALTRNIDFKKQKITLKLEFFLMQLWGMGFSNLSDPETCVIIDRFKIYQITPDTLRTFRQRMGLTRSKLQPTDLRTLLQQK